MNRPGQFFRALQQVNSNSRLAACWACWVSYKSFDVELSFNDVLPHFVSFYCLDWDRANRTETMQLLDYYTGKILDVQTIGNFGGGIYLKYKLQGRVIARFSAVNSNAVLNGIFFDAPH